VVGWGLFDAHRDPLPFLDVLKALSPYRTSHINRFGDYTLDLHRKAPPIHYKVNVRLNS